MLGKLLEEAQKGGGEGEGGSGSPKRPKSPKSPKSPKKGRKESKKKNEDSGGKSPGPSEEVGFVIRKERVPTKMREKREDSSAGESSIPTALKGMKGNSGVGPCLIREVFYPPESEHNVATFI